jgi:uncharacterized phage infection (PIP) family protein YhgE
MVAEFKKGKEDLEEWAQKRQRSNEAFQDLISAMKEELGFSRDVKVQEIAEKTQRFVDEFGGMLEGKKKELQRLEEESRKKEDTSKQKIKELEDKGEKYRQLLSDLASSSSNDKITTYSFLPSFSLLLGLKMV